jgi:retinol dehydrogenase 12
MTESTQGQKVALVTGANTGIGRITALALAQKGYTLALACRSEERTRPVLAELQALGARASWLPLELGDFGSVRRCAAQLLEGGGPLHLLVNNAGLAGSRGLTKSGFERMFGVNHLGHFLLTQLLLPRLAASAPARIVTVASRAHQRTPGIDWEAVRRPTSTLTGIREYGTSKLANILFSSELARRLQSQGIGGVSTYALHPGVIDSEIWRGLPAFLRALNRLRLTPVEEGARTTLHCATAEEAGRETGLYYSDCRPVAPSALAQDAGLARELWERSEEWVQARA